MFDPIEKHFPNASSMATYPLITTASRCMKKGMELFNNIVNGVFILKNKNKEPSRILEEILKIADKFYDEEYEIIRSFPKLIIPAIKRNFEVL